MLLCISKVINANSFQTMIQSVYILKKVKQFFVNIRKKLKYDVDYNCTELTKSSWRSFRNGSLTIIYFYIGVAITTIAF